MRKAERLFQIVNLLRHRRRAMTAQQLAQALEVSERTIYRDIQALNLSGVPIEGSAGVGYLLQRRFDLPPLMFDAEEVQAILFGVKMVRAWADQQLAQSANSAMMKVLAALPERLRDSDDEIPIMVPLTGVHDELSGNSQILRQAIRDKRVLGIDYRREDGCASKRVIEPLGLFFWGRSWTLVAWCRLRQDYRMFRIDRIQSLQPNEEGFETGPTKNLGHYMQYERERCLAQEADVERVKAVL